MTATTRHRHRHRHIRRPRVRIASMEALGFIDRPGTTTAWTTTATVQTGPAPSPPADTAQPEKDPFADWTPNEIGARLLKGNVRWGRSGFILLLTVALAALGYWLYQQPQLANASARDAVTAEATALGSQLDTVAALNATLTADAADVGPVTSILLESDDRARAIFDASASLPSSATDLRSLVADAAGDALAASRTLGDAFAYRTALIPALAAPEFETDRAFIDLDEAALQFGEWQSKFDAVRQALPTSVLPEVTAELEIISGDLGLIQTRYLDALRGDDRSSAATALTDLTKRLETAESLLGSSLADVQTLVAARITSARASLALLVG